MAKAEVAVMDFGSSKITILVGVNGVNGTFKIIATGESDYAGFMDGDFIEPENLSSAITYAKNQAENALGKKIKRLYVGVPTEFCLSKLEKLNMNLGKRTKIKQKHLDKLFLNASITYENFVVINKTPIYFLLDDNNKMINPLGCYTSQISVLSSFIMVNQSFYDFLDKVLCEIGIYSSELISSALAESLYLIEPEKRQNGAIVVDCGFITTSVNAVFGEGVTDLKSFSLGGGHITSDIMEVLKIPFSSAEQLKRKVILTLAPTKNDYYETIVDNSIVRFEAFLVNEICLARLEMIVEAINKCIQSFSNRVSDELIIYLTGGGLNYLKGAAKFIEQCLNHKVVCIAPMPLQYNKPDLSSSLSLIDAALKSYL